MDFHIVFQRGLNPSPFCIRRVRYCLFFGIRTGDGIPAGLEKKLHIRRPRHQGQLPFCMVQNHSNLRFSFSPTSLRGAIHS